MSTGKPTKMKPCVLCGKLFIPKSPNNRICSEDHIAKCPICGKDVVWNSTSAVPCCSKECRKEQTKRKNIAKYGTEHPMQNKEVQRHHRRAMLDKYGVESPLQSDEIKHKAIETNREKFGADWALGNKEFHKQIEQTMIDKYGAPFTLSSEALKAKVEATCLEKYGVTSPIQSEVMRNKAKMTNLSVSGHGNPMQNPEVYCQDSVPEMLSEVRKRTPKIIVAFHDKLAEIEIDSEYGFYIGEHMFDLAIPDQNILIEIDPAYTHSVVRNHWGDVIEMNYHLEKSKVAEGAGYRCIHVFDWDDWDKVINLTRPKHKIGARKCQIYKLFPKPVDDFLNESHMQGTVRGQILALGLVYEDRLMQVMTFGNSRYDKSHTIELLRLATRPGYSIIGGAERLFKFAVNKYYVENIISYCDRAKFSGEVYTRLGMKLIRETEPQVIWARGEEKVTSNLLRRRGFDQLFNTDFGKGSSNEELMLLHGWLPVPDCGQRVYEY